MMAWAPGWRRFRGRDLAALPAWLATGALAAAAVAAVATPSRDSLGERYAHEADRKFQARDFPAALVGYERLSQLEAGYSEHLFGLVTTLDAMGKGRRAMAIARGLGPVDRQGYPPAQLWLGRKLTALPAPDASVADEAERHLRQVPETHPLSPEAHALLGSFLLTRKRPGPAERELKKASPDRPEVQLLLTQAYLMG